MKKLRGDYLFAYPNGNEMYDIFGTWHTEKANDYIGDRITLSYFILETTEHGRALSMTLPRSKWATITNEPNWEIGSILNDTFREKNGKFINHLKDFIIEKYNIANESAYLNDEIDESF
jgi:hypothetical protein